MELFFYLGFLVVVFGTNIIEGILEDKKKEAYKKNQEKGDNQHDKNL